MRYRILTIVAVFGLSVDIAAQQADNTISIDVARFEAATNRLSIIYHLTYEDSLQLGYTFGVDSAAAYAALPSQWHSVETQSDTVSIELGDDILFDTTYFVFMRLRTINGPASEPTDSSTALIATPGFTWEPITYFHAASGDTVRAFNGHVALWYEGTWGFGLIADTLVAWTPDSLPGGLIPVSTGFTFALAQDGPSLMLGVRYDSIPAGCTVDDVRLFAESDGVFTEIGASQTGQQLGVGLVPGMVVARTRVRPVRYIAAVDTAQYGEVATGLSVSPVSDTVLHTIGGPMPTFSFTVAYEKQPLGGRTGVVYSESTLAAMEALPAPEITGTWHLDETAMGTGETWSPPDTLEARVDSVPVCATVALSVSGSGLTDTSSSWILKLVRPPIVTRPPTLISPTDGTQVTGDNVLIWSENRDTNIVADTSYAIQIATTEDFATPLIEQSGIRDTHIRLADLSLAESLPTFTPLCWRVRAEGLGDNSSAFQTRYSAYRSIVLIGDIAVMTAGECGGPIPVAPQLTRHGNGMVVTYGVRGAAPVVIELYDAAGRRLVRREQGRREPGRHVARFDNIVARGLTFVLIRSGSGRTDVTAAIE